MYFLKFLKWFWSDYLDDPAERAAFILISWGSIFFLIVVWAWITNTSAIVLAYLLITILSLLLCGFIHGIMFMRRRYLQWQALLFDKLRKQSKLEDE